MPCQRSPGGRRKKTTWIVTKFLATSIVTLATLERRRSGRRKSLSDIEEEERSVPKEKSRLHAFPPEFHIGNKNILETKESHKILGVTVQNDLRWNKQVEDMVRKATRTTWVIRRMKALGVDRDTLVALWKAEGRVHLELACPVWHSGLTVAQAQDLDRAQRVAMAAIAGRWEPSHTRQLAELSLERLGPRRIQI